MSGKIITIKVARPKRRGVMPPPTKRHGPAKARGAYNRAKTKAEHNREER